MNLFQNQKPNNQTGGSAQPSGGLFGTSGAASGGNPTSNIFGSSNSGGSAFGGGSTAGQPGTGGLFGGTGGGDTRTSGSGTGGLFGGGNKDGTSGTGAAGGGGIFGGGNSTTSNQPSSNPLMPGFNASTPGGSASTQTSNPLLSRLNTPSAGTGGGLFGGGSTPNPSNPLFGGGSTTSGNAPASSGSGGGLFGGGSTPNPSNPLFGGGTSTAQAGGSANIFGGGNTQAAPGSNALGLSNPLFGGSKPTDQSSAGTSKPAGSDFFSKPPATTSTTAGSGPSTLPTGGLFGSTTKPTENAQAPSTATTTLGGGLFGGGNAFGKKPEQPAPSTSSATGATPAASIFGNKDSAPAKDGAPAAPAAASGGLFGNKDKPAENTSTTSAQPAFGLFGASKAPSGEGKDTAGDKPKEAAASTALGLGVPSTSTAAVPSVSPPSMLRGKSIEEIVNRWSSDLDNHVRQFNKFAGEVSVWDRALIENGNNLAALYSHVLAAEREQNDIDQSLDHIEQQQKELGAALDAYEKSSQEILGGQGGSLRALDTGPADAERDKNYTLASELHTHLDDLSASLTQMIDSVNALSLPSVSGPADGTKTPSEDPMAQIAQILSSHLESLQWIDGAVREVEGKVTDVEKGVKESGLTSPSLNGGGLKSRGFGINR